MPYALIQKNLAQQIDRKTLEEASVHAPSVARADCARIQRELFGVVVTSLPHDEAIAFQTALDYFGFPTEIVPAEKLPSLTAPNFRRGIQFYADGFTALDGLGREDTHPWEEVQFATGGFLQTIVHKTAPTPARGWDSYHGVMATRKRPNPSIRHRETTSTKRSFASNFSSPANRIACSSGRARRLCFVSTAPSCVSGRRTNFTMSFGGWRNSYQPNVSVSAFRPRCATSLSFTRAPPGLRKKSSGSSTSVCAD